MSLIRINHHPSRRQLSRFGLIWLVFFGLLSGAMSIRGAPIPAIGTMSALAVLVPVIGWTFPAAMRVVYVGMAYAAFPLGLVISHVIMAVVYYLVLTPIGLLIRGLGHDPMGRRTKSETTYWVKRQEADDVTRYFRQF